MGTPFETHAVWRLLQYERRWLDFRANGTDGLVKDIHDTLHDHTTLRLASHASLCLPCRHACAWRLDHADVRYQSVRDELLG